MFKDHFRRSSNSIGSRRSLLFLSIALFAGAAFLIKVQSLVPSAQAAGSSQMVTGQVQSPGDNPITTLKNDLMLFGRGNSGHDSNKLAVPSVAGNATRVRRFT